MIYTNLNINFYGFRVFNRKFEFLFFCMEEMLLGNFVIYLFAIRNDARKIFDKFRFLNGKMNDLWFGIIIIMYFYVYVFFYVLLAILCGFDGK